MLGDAEKPLIIAGGGVHWSDAEAELRSFAERHNIPVVETVAGRTSLPQSHPLHAGPIGVTGCTSANALAAEADVVLAVGTRLQDFTTGSWTVFRNESVRIVAINTARFDATKHRAVSVVADARESARRAVDRTRRAVAAATTGLPPAPPRSRSTTRTSTRSPRPTAVRTAGCRPTRRSSVSSIATPAPDTYALTAAGGFPGELVNGWRSDVVHSFDAEYGFSCMGYEIAGGWGAKMAMPDREVVVFVGDGSYLMMNSDLYSSVLSGHKMIVIVCDNGGFAVINRLQVNQGGVPFNNLIADAKDRRRRAGRLRRPRGRDGVPRRDGLDDRRTRSGVPAGPRANDRTTVIALRTDAYSWTEGGAFWEVGVPEVSSRAEVVAARADVDAGKADQRVGW